MMCVTLRLGNGNSVSVGVRKPPVGEWAILETAVNE
jgi:hypothetical protein